MQTSFAEEETGFAKKTWRKFLNNFRKPDAKETPKEAAKKTPKGAVKEVAPLKAKPEIETAKPRAELEESPLARLSKEEIAERIKQMLEISPEITSFVPELKVIWDGEGNTTSIEYKAEGTLKELGLVDKETLIKIHNRVSNERARIQAERIQKQLEQVTRASQAAKPPHVYMPPTAPKVPVPPPQPPKPSPSPPKIPPPPAMPPSPPRAR